MLENALIVLHNATTLLFGVYISAAAQLIHKPDKELLIFAVVPFTLVKG